MAQSRGFITLATGKEEYFELAANLLRSYRRAAAEPLPFAILADRENAWTEEFDRTLLLPEASCSYLDKLRLNEFLPFDETLFIDSDCLAYGDLNFLFDAFASADDFSCFGRVLPLNDQSGWFAYEDLGELKERVQYVVGLHGGVYFLRRGERCDRVLRTARELAPRYAEFRFKGRFASPGDEPLAALAMALEDCRPIPFPEGALCCYWEHPNDLRVDMRRGEALLGEKKERIALVHWGTRFTREPLYRREAAMLRLRPEDVPAAIAVRLRYGLRAGWAKLSGFARRVRSKLRRMLR